MFTSASLPAGLFAGIDVAKDSLDLASTSSTQVLHVDNNARGRLTLLTHLQTLRPTLVVIESSGGYELPLMDDLLDAGIPVARVHPGRVRHLAKGLGILAKTDAIDARVLAEFAWRASPRITQKRSANQSELDALVTCRRQLLLVRTEQSNRRRQLTRSKPAIKSIDARS